MQYIPISNKTGKNTHVYTQRPSAGIGLYLYQRKPTPILACALAYTGVARTYERLI